MKTNEIVRTSAKKQQKHCTSIIKLKKLTTNISVLVFDGLVINALGEASEEDIEEALASFNESVLRPQPCSYKCLVRLLWEGASARAADVFEPIA